MAGACRNTAGLIRGFQQKAKRHPDQLAVEEAGFELTYSQLEAASDLMAQRIVDAGLLPGETMAFLGGSGIQRMVAYLGALKAGTPFLPLDERQPLATLRGVIEHANAKAMVVFPAGLYDLAEDLKLPVIPGLSDYPDAGSVVRFQLHDVSPDAVAYFRYTSGSTGKPKGVPVSHRTEAELMRLGDEYLQFGPDDRVALMAHFWPTMILSTLAVGGSLYFYDFPVRGGGSLAHWLKENKISILNTFAAIFRAVEIEEGTFLPDLRVARVSGDLLLRRDLERFESVTRPGTLLLNGYGSSECSYIATFPHKSGEPIAYDRLPIGYPHRPDFFAIVDDKGNALGPGETGEMVLYAPDFVQGYHNDPERTAATLRPLPAMGVEKAYFTGDQAYRDEQGLIHPVGRVDDQVKIRGYVVRPSEIEDLISRRPEVRQADVAAFEAPNGISQLACHLVPSGRGEISIPCLRNYLRGELPGYMVPGHFLVHDKLPVTTTGKIMRRALPNPLEVRAEAGESRAKAETPLQRQLSEIWASVLGHSDFGVNDDFFDIGGDSLQAMTMITGIEAALGYRMPLETLVLDGATILRLAERVEAGPDHAAVTPKPLNRSKTACSIFAVPVIGGYLSDYLGLAHLLEDVADVAGLPYREHDPKQDASLSIGDLAQEVLSLHPGPAEAPLLGYSFGGAVAYEAARRKTALGGSPSLILIDPVPVWLDPLRMLRSIWRAARQGDMDRAQRRLSSLVNGKTAASRAEDLHAVALQRYRPKAQSMQDALLILSADNPRLTETRQEWQRLIGSGLQVETAAGDHFTMMREPLVGEVARIVRRWLSAR